MSRGRVSLCSAFTCGGATSVTPDTCCRPGGQRWHYNHKRLKYSNMCVDCSLTKICLLAVCGADLLHCGVWLTAQQGSPTSPHPNSKTTSSKYFSMVMAEEATSISLVTYHFWRDRLSLCHCFQFAPLVKFLKLQTYKSMFSSNNQPVTLDLDLTSWLQIQIYPLVVQVHRPHSTLPHLSLWTVWHLFLETCPVIYSSNTHNLVAPPHTLESKSPAASTSHRYD